MQKVLNSSRAVFVCKAALFVLLSLPFIALSVQAITGSLGPDPAEKLADETGEWALRLLLLTIAITPLRKLLKASFVMRFRRMTGLFAFFYACVHLLVFIAFFVYWNLKEIAIEIMERPYITVGFASLLLLIPLAITSTNRWRRQLGRRWVTLHQLVYPSLVLALLHLIWQVRSDWLEAGIYTAIFIALVLMRFNAKSRWRSLSVLKNFR